MRRPGFAIVAVVAMAVSASCQGSSTGLSNRFGGCTFEPHTVCRGQDLASLSLEFSDLTGADFSNSSLNHSDLRHAMLRDAKLVNVNFGKADLTGADLRGADLSGAVLFQARLDNANWDGSTRTGARFCQTVLPDGRLSTCEALDSVVGAPVAPPAVVEFRLHQPVRCLNDGVGEGVEVDWRVQRSSSVAFLVDDVRAGDATGSHGIKRVPVQCDNTRHRLTIQAFGAVPPVAARSLTMSLAPGKELPPIK